MRNICAVVTDIEGTTTSLSFVKDVLFTYAYERMDAFLLHYHDRPDVAVQLREVEKVAGKPLDPGQAMQLLKQWIKEDRKITPLKAIQGMMWEEGYRNGDFRGHVYDDAAEVLKRWNSDGIELYVYSSGSVHAQKLLYGHTAWGDLNRLFNGYFDTAIGGKKDPQSYRCIAEAIGVAATQILFLSDILEELDAAKSAGMATTQLVREPGMRTGQHPFVSDFYQIDLAAPG